MKSALYFADDQVSDTFFRLRSGRVEEKEIYNQLNAAFDMISINPFFGTQVPKRLIPGIYRTKYGIDNLWKLNFHKSWRLMDSVAGDGTQVVALVLEWLSHKEYERRFGY